MHCNRESVWLSVWNQRCSLQLFQIHNVFLTCGYALNRKFKTWNWMQHVSHRTNCWAQKDPINTYASKVSEYWNRNPFRIKNSIRVTIWNFDVFHPWSLLHNIIIICAEWICIWLSEFKSISNALKRLQMSFSPKTNIHKSSQIWLRCFHSKQFSNKTLIIH